MVIRLSETEIARLIAEKKPLPLDYRERIQTRPKRGHKERELDVIGADGSEFRLIFRQSEFNPFDFSVILAYRASKTHQLFRLRRYNGKSHEHTNVLERQTFYDFHIHTATERYQDKSGLREDSYAEPTSRFADFHGAIRCMLADCGFDAPQSSQGSLFEED
ncbi:MAG: hypothetical protein C4293_02465 [Nitrospiraceae bacterium]